MKYLKPLFGLLVCLFLFLDCQPKQSENNQSPDDNTANYQPENYGRKHKKYHRSHRQSYQNNNRQNQRNNDNAATGTNIPQKVREVLAYVRANKQAMDGYVGGRRFKNLEIHLDKQTASGQRIDYQEWDVNPKQQGRNRGTERLITGSDGRAWFTSDHYSSFVEVK
jgi:ribonuclease T1